MQLEQLNQQQYLAVTSDSANLLVLAGAGSGKTRVLVQRIAWLIQERSVRPSTIMAVTFTNKAAGELKSRLAKILPGININSMWVGTFHSLANRFLRLHSARIGIKRDFQIIDSSDQLKIIKKTIKELGLDEEDYEAKKVQAIICRNKDEGIELSTLLSSTNIKMPKAILNIYQKYEKHCAKHNIMDFGQLLLSSVTTLEQYSDVREETQQKFTHILIDEFQDTNGIQYKWLQLISQQSQTVTVVGDDDQSIYGWRGAKIENIHKFSADFSEVNIVRLEQNYRSSAAILAAANALICHNSIRMGKKLWTDGSSGAKPIVFTALNEDDEAMYVVRQAREWLNSGRELSKFAVLYRSNAQSRVIEEMLIKGSIPYRIYGGVRFFERAEIKDALAYLRLAIDHSDDYAFERIINSPPRGIGTQGIAKMKEYSQDNNCSYWDAAHYAVSEKLIGGRGKPGVIGFIKTITDLRQKIDSGESLPDIMDSLLQTSGLLPFFKMKMGPKPQSRAENLEELLSACAKVNLEEIDQDETSYTIITKFLSYASLDVISNDTKGNAQDSIQLMTIHAAKGLEFPAVVMCGLEENLFPVVRGNDEANIETIEEERRLCYVGITRAMEQLHLCTAKSRRLFGRKETRKVSRFLKEIPSDMLDEIKPRSTITPVVVKFLSSNELAEDATEHDGFVLGQRVSHPKFGSGTVIDRDGMDSKMRIHIHFDRGGSKWLLASFLTLEDVSEEQ